MKDIGTKTLFFFSTIYYLYNNIGNILFTYQPRFKRAFQID